MEADVPNPTLLTRPATEGRTHIIAVTNQKGGVGKTTTAVNLAASLAAGDRKVCLIDMDPQGNATSGIGVDKHAGERSLFDVLIEHEPLTAVFQHGSIDTLSVAPSNQDLVGAEAHLTRDPNGPRRLRMATDRLLKSDPTFDYIIIDCPPSLGLLTINALIAARSVLIPVQTEYYALEGMTDMLRSLGLVRQQHNPDLALEGFLLTMMDSRLSLAQQVEEELRTAYGKHVFQTVISRSVRLSEAPSHGLPIILYDLKSKGAQAYLALAREMILNEEESPGTWPFGPAL